MRPRERGRPTRCVIGTVIGLVSLAFACPVPALADPAAKKNNEGNRLYEEKKFDDALKMYVDAQASRPGAPELHYNIGNVLFRKKEYDKAIEEYLRAQAAPDPVLSEAALFNRGNALMMQGHLEDAIQAYVQALRSRPGDADAKRNLELALRLLEQQKKRKQQQPQQQDKNQDQNKNPQQQPQQGEGGGRPPQQQKKPGEMSEDEARQVLEALQQEEKEGIKKHARAAVGDRKPPEQDW